jgi:hypothetical protein
MLNKMDIDFVPANDNLIGFQTRALPLTLTSITPNKVGRPRKEKKSKHGSRNGYNEFMSHRMKLPELAHIESKERLAVVSRMWSAFEKAAASGRQSKQ